MSNVLITGASGMIGKGALLECIKSPEVKSITLLTRSPIDVQHAKIKSILLEDFTKIDTIKSQLDHINGCFHCMGVSAIGMNETQYSKLTFDITKKLADLCFDLNPDMTFIYVSGAGTDRSEKSKSMWARVKGKTENYILAKEFGKTYMFRPGFIIPENGIQSRTKLYKRIYTFMRPFFPLLKKLRNVTTTSKIGKAMINVLIQPKLNWIEFDNKAINKIADN